jgi:uncharacterized membrane protein
MLAAIDAYSISVTLHVSAVVIGLGATFALAVAFPLALRLDARHLPFVHHLSLALNQRVAGPAVLVIVATGIYQTIDGPWSFGDPWISATFAIVIALGALNGIYFMPTDRKLAAQAEREVANGGAVTDDYHRKAQREALIGTVAGLLVIVAVFLMITKPGA